MNPLLRFLLGTVLQRSTDLTTEQATPALWGGPEDAMANFDSASKRAAGRSPADHIRDAFRQLKDMHKDPALEQAMTTPPPASPFTVGGHTPMPSPRPMDTPSPLDTAQYPFGPVGAPHAMAQAAPRPAEAPPGPPLDLMQFNTAMMRDPSTGEFIDPRAAQTAEMHNPFKGLFG